VYQYAVGTDGALSPLPDATLPTVYIPGAIVSDPAGQHVYIADLSDRAIAQYAVSPSGGLTPLSPATANPFAYILSYLAATVDPTGHFLYLTGISPNPPPDYIPTGLVPPSYIGAYVIGADGTLTPHSIFYTTVPGPGTGPLAIDPSGRFAYQAGSDGTSGLVWQFNIGADGTLTPMQPASVAATQTVRSITISTDGRTAYVLSSCIDNACDGQIAPYAIGASGTLTATGATVLTGSHVGPVALVTNGASSAYVLTDFMGVDFNSGAVYQYTIDGAGALAADTPPSLNTSFGPVTLSADQGNLYVLSAAQLAFEASGQLGGHIDHYVVDSAGLLTQADTTALATGVPGAITIVPAAH
jgi:6-phosphogluconolactonase (cycloisomerase 2 family)